MECVVLGMLLCTIMHLTSETYGSASSSLNTISKTFHIAENRNVTSTEGGLKCADVRRIRCAKLCVELVGCRAFLYSPSIREEHFQNKDLQYYSVATGDTYAKEQLEILMQTGDTYAKEQLEILMQTGDTYAKEQLEETKKSRILLAPLILLAPEMKETSIGQLFLSNRSSAVVTSHKFKNIEAQAYISKTEILWLCTEKPTKLTAFSVNDNVVIKKRDIRCQRLAVDQGRLLVFMTTLVKGKGFWIQKMTASGKNIKLILKWRLALVSIATYDRLKAIFACSYRDIVTVNYEGQGKRILVLENGLKCSTLDQGEGFLWYIDREKVKQLAVTSRYPSTYLTFQAGTSAMSLVYYEKKLYVWVTVSSQHLCYSDE